MRSSRYLVLLAVPLVACSAILGAPDLPDIAADAGGSDSTADDGSSGGGQDSTAGDSSNSGSDSSSANDASSGGGSDSASSSSSSGGPVDSSGSGSGSSSGSSSSSSGTDSSAPDTGAPQDSGTTDAIPLSDGSTCGTCTGGMTCQNGTCQCPSGTHDCSGTCSSDTSTSSCGTTSCTACAAPPSGQGTASCNGTTCGVNCNANYSPCSGDCVNEQIDPNNCNGCGTVCKYGLCQTAACAASFFGAGHPSAGGGTALSIGADTLLGDKVTSGKTSSVVAIGAQTNDAGVKMRLALFSDNAGKPGSYLTGTNELTTVGGGATEGSVPATGVTLGTAYWIMVLTNATEHLATETTTTTWYFATGVTYGPIPASFATAGDAGTSSATQNIGDLYFVTAP